jgi:hypothetical protein
MKQSFLKLAQPVVDVIDRGLIKCVVMPLLYGKTAFGFKDDVKAKYDEALPTLTFMEKFNIAMVLFNIVENSLITETRTKFIDTITHLSRLTARLNLDFVLSTSYYDSHNRYYNIKSTVVTLHSVRAGSKTDVYTS